MPNTAKSLGLHPHGYAATAREKLPRHHHQHQQHQQQRSVSAYVPPQSTRPFMTMVLQSPLTTTATNSSASSQLYYQQQQQTSSRRHLAPPASFHSYNHTQPQEADSPTADYRTSSTTPQAYSTSRAMDVYEKLQPPRTTTSTSNVSAAWRDEIEQRARAMDRSVGMKRPAPSSSQRPVHQQLHNQYDAEGFSTNYRAAPFTPPAPVTGALPTLSCLLQRNASDASSSSTGSSPPRRSAMPMFNGGSYDEQASGKRQRMFAPPPLPTTSLSSRAYPQAADLFGADNDHLRKILEEEVAFYNQRSSRQEPRQQSPLVQSSRYDAAAADYNEVKKSSTTVAAAPEPVYSASSSKSRKPQPSYYGTRPFAAASYARGRSTDSPLSRSSDLHRAINGNGDDDREKYESDEGDEERQAVTPPMRRAFPNTRVINSSYKSHVSSEVPLNKYNAARTTRTASSEDEDDSRSPREFHERDIPDRSFAGRAEQSMRSRSPPPPVSRRQQQSQYSVDIQQPSRFASGRPSMAAPSRHQQQRYQHQGEAESNSSMMRHSNSSFRLSSSSSASDLGESAIEAASGLLEERSPSKRESITKLLLKSKEFLKAKSLVRNRNNEIDWVATFLNVGFESSSIYSLMCPLRKGRWKAEEEKYTMELLRLIESGAIRLRHGQSIRGFIAKKLHSDDMRVLKKLSNCKMFHFARMITPHMADEEEIDEGVAGASASLVRLDKLRSEFLRSVQLEALVAVRKYLSDSSIRELLNGRG